MHFFDKLKKMFFFIKIRKASAHQRAELMRSQFYHLGKNVELYTLSFGTEPYLISIGDNVVCAAGVTFVNHDVSCFRMAEYLGVSRNQVDKVGPIILKDNCFIGARTMLMPGSSVGKNSVIAAGSIVTKTVPDNEVWGGVPCKVHHDHGSLCAKGARNKQKISVVRKKIRNVFKRNHRGSSKIFLWRWECLER